MALSTVTIQGKILTPGGVAPTAGTLRARLSKAGSALDGAASQRVAGESSAAIGVDGSISLALVPNDAIVPSGTVYEVDFAAIEPNGVPVRWHERWQLASAPSPIDIGAVPRLDVVPGVAVASIPVRTSLAGIWVGDSPPANPVTYAQWVATGVGYWGWLDTSTPGVSLVVPVADLSLTAAAPALEFPVPGSLSFETTSLTPYGLAGAYVNEVPWDGIKGAARDNAVAHGGAYSMKLVASGAAPWVQMSRPVAIPASGTVAFERWFRYNAIPASTGMLGLFALAPDATASDYKVLVGIRQESGLCRWDAARAVVSIYPYSSMTSGNWYRLRVALNCAANTYDVTLYDAAGTSLVSAPGIAPTLSFAGAAGSLIIGRHTSAGFTYWFDDLLDGA